MKNIIFKYILSCAAGLAAIVSCNKEDSGNGILSISSDSPEVQVASDNHSADITFETNGGSVHFTVITESAWTVSVSPEADWCKVVQANSDLSISADEFVSEESGQSRSTTVELSTDEDKVVIAVTQSSDAKTTLSLETKSQIIPKEGGAVKIHATTNKSGIEAELTDMAWPWAECTVKGDSIFVTAGENRSGEKLTATLLVSAGKGTNVASQSLSITQENGALILIYETTGTGTVVSVPIFGYVNCEVDWGDGTVDKLSENITENNRPEHIYEKAGQYTVSINGSVSELNSEDATEISQFLKEIVQWGDLNLKSMEYALCNTSITSIPLPEPKAFADVTTFSSAFNGCAGITEIPKGLFDYCTKTTSFLSVFYDCVAVKEIPEGLFDNCPAVTNYASAFNGCAGITEIPAGLFKNSPLASNFNYCFQGCLSLKEIPADLFAEQQSISGVTALFQDCSSLTSIPAGLLDKATKTAAIQWLFKGCTGITHIPAGLFDKLDNVTNAREVFTGCTGITSVPEGLFDNMPKVKNMRDAFKECTALTSVPTNLFDKCTQITTVQGLFQNCVNLGGESPYTLVDGVKVHLYERNSYPDTFKSITGDGSKNVFTGCVKLSDYNSIPTSWKE